MSDPYHNGWVNGYSVATEKYKQIADAKDKEASTAAGCIAIILFLLLPLICACYPVVLLFKELTK